MNRSSFFKTLFVTLASPKILSEIDFTKPVIGITEAAAIPMNPNMALISQLQLLTPKYYKEYVEKYGDEDFTWWLKTYGDEGYSATRYFEHDIYNETDEECD